jgi:hypothetical protein
MCGGFEAWFTVHFSTPPSSRFVIILDNASIFSFLVTKVPCLNTRKAGIMAWLSSKHISHMTSETRAALLQLVKMNKLRKYYEIDTISMLRGTQWSDCCRNCHCNPSELLLA